MTAALALRPFVFEEASRVRVIIRDDEPWFVLADVCRALDLGSPHKVAGRLDDDEKTTVDTRTLIMGIPGCDFDPRVQSVTLINESGLYSVIMTSRKPEAKRFKKWVTAEVLPSIRKTGSYHAALPSDSASALPTPDLVPQRREMGDLPERALRLWLDNVNAVRLLYGRDAARRVSSGRRYPRW
jgi:prophage antirepressor-like protein